MVERYGAFVCEEDLPFREFDDIICAAGFGEEGLRQRLGKGTAGDGDFKDLVALNAGILGAEDIGSQRWREIVNAGKGEEVGLLSHNDELRISFGE